MNSIKNAAIGFALVGSLWGIYAPKADAQAVVAPSNASSITSEGSGSETSGCLSPADSCNTTVSGVTQKNTANQLNGNNPTATSSGGSGGAGGSSKVFSNPTATSGGGEAVINQTETQPQLQVGVRVGGTANTPTTFGAGGGLEVICGNRVFRISGTVKSKAINILGLIASGSSSPSTIGGSEEVLNQAVKCSDLGQINAVNGSEVEDQFTYFLNHLDEGINFVQVKLIRNQALLGESEHFAVLVEKATTPQLKRVAVLYGLKVLARASTASNGEKSLKTSINHSQKSVINWRKRLSPSLSL